MIEQTTDSVFCYEYDPPIPIDAPIKKQIKMLYDGVLVECIDVCAKTYGANKAEQVIGKKLTELFGTTTRSLDEFYRVFIMKGYHTVDEEGVEILEDGNKRYFLNNGYGVIENDKLIRIWGTFRDITDRKLAEEANKRRPVAARGISPRSIVSNIRASVVPFLRWLAADLNDPSAGTR